MGLEAARVVEQIRQKRSHWTDDLQLADLTHRTRESIQKRPIPWLVGGLVVGLVTYKWIQSSAESGPRSHPRIHQAVTRGVLAAALAAWKVFGPSTRRSQEPQELDPSVSDLTQD